MLYTEKELAALAVAARDTIPGYRDQSVRLIGYWGPGCDLPMPVVGSCSLSEADRARLLAYLQAPTHAREGYMGSSRCRCCGSSNGAHEVFDGRWVWPDGLAHYVEAHHVALPDDFVEHCLTTGAHPVVAPHATLRCGQPLSTGGHPVRHFVCLCPHSVAVLLPSGETWVCESSGSARLVEDHRFFDRVPGPGGDESRSIELAQAVFGEVVGLPPPQAGVGYIVSQMVAIACHDRRDLFFPDSGSAVRDASGQVVAVRRLLRPPLMVPHERAWG